MGWVNTKKNADGKVRFTAMYRDIRDRPRSAGTFSTRRDAERAWQRAQIDQAAGRLGEGGRSALRFRDYVEEHWLPHHVMEATTRESYGYLINRYLLPDLGGMRLQAMLPGHVRQWVTDLVELHQAKPPTVRKCKVILDSILSTALNDRLVVLHAGKGVKTPPVAVRPRPVITVEQFERLLAAIPDPGMRLMVETDIETGLRWGELTELRVKDLDVATGMLTVQRVVVHLRAANPDGARFVVKPYPKSGKYRRLPVAPRMAEQLQAHWLRKELAPDDLLFTMTGDGPTAPAHPGPVEGPSVDVGMTEPDDRGRQYVHGTLTAYSNGRCRCEVCRAAMARYRAERRAAGVDQPRGVRRVATDGHVDNGWFRRAVWRPALKAAEIPFAATPHDLRHAHASWLLAGGADIQIVKERLGHGSITTTERYLRSLPGGADMALTALASVRGR